MNIGSDTAFEPAQSWEETTGVPEEQPDDDRDGTEAGTGRRRRRPGARGADAHDEVAALLRILMAKSWLIAGQDDDTIRRIQQHAGTVSAAVHRMGWVVHIGRDLVRLSKSAPADVVGAPAPIVCSWVFLLAAAAETLPPQATFKHLMRAAHRAAADADLTVRGDIGERRAVARAFGVLAERGIVVETDGHVEDFVADAEADALLQVHHTRLAHLVANSGPVGPDLDPQAWLDAVSGRGTVEQRMLRRLVDRAVVHTVDLDEDERDWLSRRLRASGAAAAAALGVRIERRAEGAAFVVAPDDVRLDRELGPHWFPGSSGARLAALLLAQRVRRSPGGLALPGPGWWAVDARLIPAHLAAVRREHLFGAEFDDDDVFAKAVLAVLEPLDLVRVLPGACSDDATVEAGQARDMAGPVRWCFSPALQRWARPPLRSLPTTDVAAPSAPEAAQCAVQEGLELGLTTSGELA
jgi:uncharacterized protein (TIGR02678 family)